MRNAKIVILVLLLVALFPYLLTCFYALPFADDFCFGWTASENIPFVQKFLNQYLHWNGRYTSDVLVNLHPLTTGSLLFYQCICFVSILSMLCVVFILVRKFLSNNMASVFCSLVFSTLLFELSTQYYGGRLLVHRVGKLSLGVYFFYAAIAFVKGFNRRREKQKSTFNCIIAFTGRFYRL